MGVEKRGEEGVSFTRRREIECFFPFSILVFEIDIDHFLAISNIDIARKLSSLILW